jgi:predicted nucleotide-binding protein
VSFAIFVLTADDILIDTRTNETIRRARQNVILEIGYFWALLGRKTGVAFLVDGHADMDLPSDLNGVEHIPITADLGQTKLQLKNELQKAGIVR